MLLDPIDVVECPMSAPSAESSFQSSASASKAQIWGSTAGSAICDTANVLDIELKRINSRQKTNDKGAHIATHNPPLHLRIRNSLEIPVKYYKRGRTEQDWPNHLRFCQLAFCKMRSAVTLFDAILLMIGPSCGFIAAS